MDSPGRAADVAPLALPLPGEQPAGANLRQDFSPQSLYYRLRDARAEARELERRIDQQVPGADLSVPVQWRTVRDLAVKALAEQTKDLEIAVWLTEALVRIEGIAGLTTGSALIADLVKTLWDGDLHPLPDEDGMITRVAPITGLNGEGREGTLMQPLRKCVLFVGPDGQDVTYWQYTQSEALESIVDSARRKQRLDAKVVPLADLAAAAKRAEPAVFVALRAELRNALAAWTLMSERLDARAGADAPPTGRVRDLLSAMLRVAEIFAPPELAVEPEDAAVPENDTTPDVTLAEAGAGAPGASRAARPVSRDDMLRELGRIAEYFRRTEPHSPLAYTLEEAVRRGRLTWPELLAELVPDDSVRSAMLNMLGIRPAPPRA